jgi:hypothetical protein
MKILLILVIVLAVLGGAIDVGSRIAMQHQLEQRINSYEPSAAAKVTIHGFPFLLKLIADGRVDKITAHAAGISQGSFVLDRVDVTVTGVRINRTLFVRQRQLEIVAIDTGTVTADMTQADFDRLVGYPVVLGNGTAQVTVAGVSVTAPVSVRNGQLVVAAAGLPISVPIPNLPVLPCLANVAVIPGHLVGSCTFHQVPPALRNALQGALAGPGR